MKTNSRVKQTLPACTREVGDFLYFNHTKSFFCPVKVCAGEAHAPCGTCMGRGRKNAKETV